MAVVAVYCLPEWGRRGGDVLLVGWGSARNAVVNSSGRRGQGRECTDITSSAYLQNRFGLQNRFPFPLPPPFSEWAA